MSCGSFEQSPGWGVVVVAPDANNGTYDGLPFCLLHVAPALQSLFVSHVMLVLLLHTPGKGSQT